MLYRLITHPLIHNISRNMIYIFLVLRIIQINMFGCDKEMAHSFVVGDKKIFGEVIGEIVATFAPVEVKLPLTNSIANPMVTHIKSLGSF